jgi:hypothetical protein
MQNCRSLHPYTIIITTTTTTTNTTISPSRQIKDGLLLL